MKQILKCFDQMSKMDYESFLGALLLMQENRFFEYFESVEKGDIDKTKEIEKELKLTATAWANSELRLIPDEINYLKLDEEY